MNLNKKCIFLYIHSGFSLRYLVRSSVCKNLIKENYHIVLVVHNANEPGFKEKYESRNISVEQFNIEGCEIFLKTNKLQRVLIQIRSFVLNERHGKSFTTTVDDFRKYFLYEKNWVKGYGIKSYVLGKLFVFIVEVLKKIKSLRYLLIWFETIFYSPDLNSELFQKYSPDLLVVTALAGFKYNEIFAREAIKNDVPVCCVILSWDNTSGHGMPGYKPNHVISWTDSMKEELVKLNDIDDDRVSIGGVAHWDPYYQNNFQYTKEQTYKHFDLDLDKKTLLYITKSPKRFPWGPSLVDDIANAIANKTIIGPTQLLVRIHPLHYRKVNNKFIFQEIIDEYHEVTKKYSFVKLNCPEFESKEVNFDLKDNETKLLSSLLTHSSLMLNMFSTMAIESAIHDLPVINMSIQEVCKGDYINSRQDIMTDYNQVHNRRAYETGGVDTVFTLKELYQKINIVLSNPGIGKKEREELKNNEAGPFEGNAGEMIAKQISILI
jgi:hypothetical protein